MDYVQTISLVENEGLPDYVVDVCTSALSQTENPGTWVSFQLEVTQVSHDDGVHYDRPAFRAQSYL